MILADLPLFAAVPMTRRPDHDTSTGAADRVRRTATTLHRQVLEAIAGAGADGLTDRELETLPAFRHLAPSTARKRRSELFHAGLLEKAGVRDRLTVWTVTAGATA